MYWVVKAPNWSHLHWLLPSSLSFIMNETLLNTTPTRRKMNTSCLVGPQFLYWSGFFILKLMLLCVRGQACWIGVCSVPLWRFDQSETGARPLRPINAHWSRVERVVVCMMFTCKPADRRGHGPWFWRHRSVPALWRHDVPTGVRRLKSNCFFLLFIYFIITIITDFYIY